MTPERYKQVGQIFDAALGLDSGDRAAFLEDACDGDGELRREVESLLDAHDEARGYFAAPAMEVAADLISQQKDPSLIGHSLDHYRVLSLLGAGGMGKVYLAEDTRLGRKVALKLLPDEFTQDQGRVHRFEREARAVSSLNHPNIITIFEVGQVNGRHFIATEFVAGRTLRAHLQGERLKADDALDIVIQIAGALAAAHEAGIVHRDIKPENVMVRPDGLVKVLDFGLAKLVERREPFSDTPTVSGADTSPGVLLGTARYMAPEQARCEEVDRRSDIFSLGVTLYEMVGGRPPFDGATMSDVIAALLTAEPPPLRRHCAEVPEEMERIVGKCLSKDREARYQSAEELISELKTLRTGSQSEGAPTRRIERAGSRLALWRWPVVVAIAAALIAGLVYFLVSRRAPAARQDQIKSLAVLPLENLSADPAQEYFADGMTEALISNLAQARALQVVSRTSVMRFKGSRKPLAEIARELNVDAVIEGSVQRDGGRLKITVSLIQASTEMSLWTDTYERELTDVLRLQSEVAQAIIQGIQIKLTSQEQMRLASARQINPTAYVEYLRGRFYANRQIKSDNEIAIQTLERAVALDPTFAAAHAELAQACVWRYHLFTPGEKQWEEKAFVAVGKAFSLDPESAVAHLARGRLLWTFANHFPHEKAIQDYRRALTLNPSLDEAQNQLALVYNHIGAFEQALQKLEKAVTVNPTNNLAQFRIGQTLLFQGKYEQALTALRNSPKEANPSLVGSSMAIALIHLGRRAEAVAIIEEFLRDYPGDTDGGLFTGIQALLEAMAGAENRAEGKIRSAVEKGKGFGHFHHTAYNIACAYSVMKKSEPAIKWLQWAADNGFPCYQLFENDPYLDHLRKNPRFIALMAKLKEQWERYRTLL